MRLSFPTPTTGTLDNKYTLYCADKTLRSKTPRARRREQDFWIVLIRARSFLSETKTHVYVFVLRSTLWPCFNLRFSDVTERNWTGKIFPIEGFFYTHIYIFTYKYTKQREDKKIIILYIYTVGRCREWPGRCKPGGEYTPA